MLAGVPPKLRAKAEARLDLVAVWAWTRGDGDVRLGLSRDVARDLKTAQTHHAEPLYVALEVYVSGHGAAEKMRNKVCWALTGQHRRGQHYRCEPAALLDAVRLAARDMGVTIYDNAARLRLVLAEAERLGRQV